MRRTVELTVTKDNRDKGKTFLITEMSASAAEDWAARAFFELMRSGVDIGGRDPSTGMAGIAVLGLKALSGVRYSEAKLLMNEMFSCVQIKEAAIVRSIVEEDIEEVQTRLDLRLEVFALHTGFSSAELRSKLSQTSPE